MDAKEQIVGLPFAVGERNTYYDMAFVEITMTGKVGALSANLLGPIARVSPEYAEFIVTACNAHDQLVEALKVAQQVLRAARVSTKFHAPHADDAIVAALTAAGHKP